MVDSLKELKRGHIVFAGERIFKLVKIGAIHRDRAGMDNFEKVAVRTAPPSFTGGLLDVKDYHEYTLTRHIFGSRLGYEQMLQGNRWKLDVTCAAFGEGDPLPHYADVKAWTKMDLMAYIMVVHGPLTRDDIMRRVAALEELPWIATSHTSCFQGASEKGTVMLAGKDGRKQLYAAGEEGVARAYPILTRLGNGPALAVK